MFGTKKLRRIWISRSAGMCFEIGTSEPSLVPLPPLVSEEVFQLLAYVDYRTIGLFTVLFGNTAAAGKNAQEARRPYAVFQTRGGFFRTSSVISSRMLFSEKVAAHPHNPKTKTLIGLQTRQDTARFIVERIRRCGCRVLNSHQPVPLTSEDLRRRISAVQHVPFWVTALHLKPQLTHTHTNKAHPSWDLVANYMPIIGFFPPLFIFLSFRVKDVAHAKLFACLLCGDSLGKQVFN